MLKVSLPELGSAVFGVKLYGAPTTTAVGGVPEILKASVAVAALTTMLNAGRTELVLPLLAVMVIFG